MNATTFNSRLEAAGLFTKKGDLNARYSSIIEHLAAGLDRFHPCCWHRNGRRHQLEDKGGNIRRVLEALHLSYIEGNDAPRGGREGDYIEITPAARRALAPVRADFSAWKNAKKGGRA